MEASSQAPVETVCFTVNVCATDAPFIDQTLPHMIRALDFAFVERRVALDPGEPTGRFRRFPRGSVGELRTTVQGLLDRGVVDRVDEIPWDPSSQEEVFQRYFGSSEVAARSVSGTAVYQYLWALARCGARYALHVDSDMLFHRGEGRSWISEGVEFLRSHPEAVLVTPPAGPPQAERLVERLLQRPVRRQPGPTWQRNQAVSTRCFLCDLERLESRALPLIQKTAGELLERTLTHTFERKGLESWCLMESGSWAIHVWRHNESFLEHAAELIAAVEDGVYPFVRKGHRWDLRTDGRNTRPWLRAIRRARARRST
jgi:hypothetical protein